MIKTNLLKLKKYLFLISLFTLLITFSHIVYEYVFFDAKSIPIKGGTISEGIVGEVSHLNPLISTTDYNKYIIGILYRSLLKYDVTEKKIVGDLANCDISNLAYIECFLETNINWSNGKPITVKDVVSTYNILKTTNVNPVVKSLLADTAIEEKTNSIVFRNAKRNINFLNVFFQPILNEEVINNLGVDDLSKPFSPNKDSLYSGKYKVALIKEDKNLGIVELSLEKNENYFQNDVYIDKLIFKFFKDNNSIIKNKDVINIFNDSENILGRSVPRLQSNYYTLPKYTAIFINSDKIVSKSLRNFLLNKIDREKLIKVLGKDLYKEVINPYLIDYNIDKDIENKNIESIMENNGFFKKPELTKLILGTELAKTQTGTVDIKTEDKSISVKDIEEKENTDLSYIESGLSKKYSFITEDDILLKGSIKKDKPTAVYIDDYKLKGYKEGDDYFYFRLKEETYETIKEGKNSYKIYFEIKGKKVLKEEFVVFYYKDELKLEKAKTSFYESFIKAIKPSEENKQKVEKKVTIDDSVKLKLDSIDDKYFYNKNLEKYTLKLMYIGGERDIAGTSEFIKTTLSEYGIEIQADSIDVTDLGKFISDGNSFNDYDMILAGINLGYFDFNIYPYFHSSQAKSGYNFSNVKKLSLDLILEEINSNKIDKETLQKKQEQALNIIKEEQIVKTLYTPLLNLLVDKNIHNKVDFNSIGTGQVDRIGYLSQIYINEKREVNYKDKGLLDFFKFLYKIITG
ncbi:MAG: ABC transporter substrate-binding protein [Candidatus Gracilibacteria bacterium]